MQVLLLRAAENRNNALSLYDYMPKNADFKIHVLLRKCKWLTYSWCTFLHDIKYHKLSTFKVCLPPISKMRGSPSMSIPLKSEIYNIPMQFVSKYEYLENICGKLPIEEPINI